MSFVALGGDAGVRPTFFELVAAEKLMPSLKAAVLYSLSVYAQRRPALHHLLDREDELFFLLSMALDRQALAANGGSFAEGLYGLRRAPASGSSGGSSRQPLTDSQRSMSLILLTLVPFLRSKLDSLHQRLQQQQQQQQLQGWRTQPPGTSAAPAAPGSSSSRQGPASPAWLQQLRWRALARRAFQLLYPWVVAGHEGARFAYQLLYLLGRTPYYSPGLHLLGLEVVRLTGQEAMQQDQERRRRRAERLSRLARPGGGPWLWRLLRQGWARAGHLAADHTRSTLILAVFAFKLLEWWYTSAEQRLGDPKALPPPPPPPALPAVGVAAGGVALPDDVALCPLCGRRRTNPAMLATSGYVFCYPCIHREVEERGRCPVTHAPAGLDHVRRLYQSA
ncbi:hypothetical protein CHLNCDRAFT_48657 [Chlorella variabilis]|uniref:Peroxisome biogenesis protein 12 n=1 Tax=Chlorella variabilis TaxID=554065 RepID=E1Z9D1_CHLVA|nr:hypothetical protein CHLNCDRAFT_48657 [Chlorella variabilis]EFN57496.1 hypothetical protein CHLNCDRAFT_48657 [Chlorella variabilis]|eukprot:XP_005849598.1 hypothetical protein CHLNCDRAFT_48657 [Chlorella variabilis]